MILIYINMCIEIPINGKDVSVYIPFIFSLLSGWKGDGNLLIRYIWPGGLGGIALSNSSGGLPFKLKKPNSRLSKPSVQRLVPHLLIAMAIAVLILVLNIFKG